jgi:hypothetical protein
MSRFLPNVSIDDVAMHLLKVPYLGNNLRDIVNECEKKYDLKVNDDNRNMYLAFLERQEGREIATDEKYDLDFMTNPQDSDGNPIGRPSFPYFSIMVNKLLLFSYLVGETAIVSGIKGNTKMKKIRKRDDLYLLRATEMGACGNNAIKDRDERIRKRRIKVTDRRLLRLYNSFQESRAKVNWGQAIDDVGRSEEVLARFGVEITNKIVKETPSPNPYSAEKGRKWTTLDINHPNLVKLMDETYRIGIWSETGMIENAITRSAIRKFSLDLTDVRTKYPSTRNFVRRMMEVFVDYDMNFSRYQTQLKNFPVVNHIIDGTFLFALIRGYATINTGTRGNERLRKIGWYSPGDIKKDGCLVEEWEQKSKEDREEDLYLISREEVGIQVDGMSQLYRKLDDGRTSTREFMDRYDENYAKAKDRRTDMELYRLATRLSSRSEKAVRTNEGGRKYLPNYMGMIDIIGDDIAIARYFGHRISAEEVRKSVPLKV